MIKLQKIKDDKDRPEATFDFLGAVKSLNAEGRWCSDNFHARLLSIHIKDSPYLVSNDKADNMFREGDNSLTEYKRYRYQTFFVPNRSVIFLMIYIDGTFEYKRIFKLFEGDIISTDDINKFLADYEDMKRKKKIIASQPSGVRG